MTSPELDNLVRIGKLKRDPASDEEIAGLLHSAEDRLNDAGRTDLSYSSRFDLAYNAAHAMALAALRRAGYARTIVTLPFKHWPTPFAWPRKNGACWQKRTSGAISPSTRDISSATIRCFPN